MKPSARRVLAELRLGPQTTHSLMQPEVGGVRFGARLRELREAGCVIAEERLPLPTRGSRYTLTVDAERGRADEHNATPPASAARSLPCVTAPASLSADGALFDPEQFTAQASYRDAA